MSRWGEQKNCLFKLSNWPLGVSEWGIKRCVAGFQAPGHPVRKAKPKEGLTYVSVRTSPSFTLEPSSLPEREIPQRDGDPKGQPASLLPLLSLAGPKGVYSVQG